MKKALVAGLLFALIACDGKVITSDSMQKGRLNRLNCPIPLNYQFKATTKGVQYQPYRVHVDGNKITWNGAYVTTKKLTEYARQLFEIPSDAGGVTFRVVEVTCDKRLQVRNALSLSGLCQANRCWEDDKLREEPIAYPHEE